jgi:hypothetical protein
MPSSREDYVILSEVLRKMDLNENYVPSDREYKVVVSLLEREDIYSRKQSKSKKPSNFDW